MSKVVKEVVLAAGLISALVFSTSAYASRINAEEDKTKIQHEHLRTKEDEAKVKKDERMMARDDMKMKEDEAKAMTHGKINRTASSKEHLRHN